MKQQRNSHKRAANEEFIRKRQRRLQRHGPTMKWLGNAGLSAATINFYKLGLAENYCDRENRQHANALLAPVLSEAGIFTSRAVYCNMPQITVNPLNENRWLRGSPATYYSEKFDGQTSLLVLDDLVDLWLTRQMLGEWLDKMSLLLICSTHPATSPFEWRSASFWSRFERVYIGYRNNVASDRATSSLFESVGCEMRRLRLPLDAGADWSEFWRRGGRVEDFYRLLAESPVIGTSISFSIPEADILGRFAYRPIDLCNAFYRGYIYYPVKTLINSLEAATVGEIKAQTRKTTRTETVFIRSDRTLHSVKTEPYPRGTPPAERVMRLTDGTLIEASPSPPVNPTWSWKSIEGYLRKKLPERPLGEILNDVRIWLRNSVRLSFDFDCDLLTLMTPVSFVQAIFEAVPVAFISGDGQNGAARLGKAMCGISANAVSIPPLSRHDLFALLDRVSGFAYLNYREFQKAASADQKDNLPEMLRLLKISGIKELSSNHKALCRMSGHSTDFNLYGVKLVDCSGLGERLSGDQNLEIKIYKEFSDMSATPMLEIASLERKAIVLRDELHRWSFENVSLINSIYQDLFPASSDRHLDFIAPLRVFAQIAGDRTVNEGLKSALKANDESVVDLSDPVEVMIQAVRNLVREGYNSLCANHIILEMKYLLGIKFDPSSGETGSLWQNPSWIGKQLRNYGMVDDNAPAQRISVSSLSMRCNSISEQFLSETHSENDVQSDFSNKFPSDFCRSCNTCRYRKLNCPIMPFKLT